MSAKIELINGDCMEGIKDYPDKYFELCIVDPPYGIGKDGQREYLKNPGHNRKHYEFKGWDIHPTEYYFIELFRTSKNQIIFGANYFVNQLFPSMGWVFWDKGQRNLGNSDGELVFTSFQKALRVKTINRKQIDLDGSIHPTQKPVALYKWLLKNYAKEGDKILDTHLGSGSIAIACYDMKYDLTGYEIDKDYFEAMTKRFENHKKQLQINYD